MILKNNGITDMDSWNRLSPPTKKEHWKNGRSAMELARYMTAAFPALPQELEGILAHFCPHDAALDWGVEHVTALTPFGLGVGEGRHHDAFLYGNDIVVGIEGKADESLDKTLEEKLKNASQNQRHRIDGMLQMLYEKGKKVPNGIRYQLLTACTGTLLEAIKHRASTAVVLVLVFKKKPQGDEIYFSPAKIEKNDRDIRSFIDSLSTEPFGDMTLIRTPFGAETGVSLYFQKMEFDV